MKSSSNYFRLRKRLGFTVIKNRGQQKQMDKPNLKKTTVTQWHETCKFLKTV